MLGGIIWRDMTFSGSDFLYSCTWNPSIVIILDRKPFWTSRSVNWGISVSVSCIKSSLPYHKWHLKLGGNAIIIRMGSVECWDIFLFDLSIHVWSIASSVTVSTFSTLAILYLIITYWTVLDNFYNTSILSYFSPFLTQEEPCRIRYFNSISWLGISEIVLINMCHISFIMVAVFYLAWLLFWEDEYYLCDKVFCCGDLVSIIIGSSEINSRFKIIIRHTYLIYKSPNLLYLGYTLPILIRSVKIIFQICGECLNVACHLVIVK